MNLPLRVLLAQINTTVGDFEGNKKKILRMLEQAAKEKADLVTFPELALTGYPPEDLLFQRHFIDCNLKLLRRIAPHVTQVAAVLGFVDRDKRGRLYNAAAVLAGGKIKAIYHKTELPNYGVFDERRYFEPGKKPLIVKIGAVRVGITICEDIWLKTSYVYSRSFRGRADVLVNISASPYHLGKQRARQVLVRDLAKHLAVPVIYQNLVGGQDELVFDGGSLAATASGRFLAEARRFEEDAVLVEFNREKRPLRGSPAVGQMSVEEEVYKALVLGTADYVRKCGFKKALVGLSGGIDSALVARIAVDALGPDNVIGVTLPSHITSRATYHDAKRLARQLGMRCLEFNIRELFECYLKTLKKNFAGLAPDATEENLQARIRGNLMMALSNKWGALVLTTGNKSEIATGYCTLYGDMAGGFAVIKDVPKTLVFRLARYRNALAPKGSIPETTLTRAPTAELKLGQKDQDTLPPYEFLDPFLQKYVEEDVSLDRIKVKGISKKTAQRIAGRVDHNEYKRRQAPPGIKITPRAFGRDRRMPVVNCFKP